ncbi:Flavin carrier protein 2 [Penicillium rolfsii]|nr:Flavin carrier protein 2 [Penicillium rolfsii]
MPVLRWLGFLHLARLVNAVKLLESSALIPCSDSSIIKTNNFRMTLTPDNYSLAIEFDGEINYSGKIIMNVDLLVYGYSFLTTQVDPCDYNTLSGFCPLVPENMTVPSATLSLSKNTISDIPSIAYSIPDLDAVARITLLSKSTNESVTCIEAHVINSTTVYQAGVSWTLAIITGLGIFASIILSIIGYSNIATQISFRTLLFLGFMQSQAMAGLTAVELKPLVQNWTQDFQWTMGIASADFLQTITTWFQRATGGTAANLFSEAGDISVGLLKRSAESLVKRNEPTTDGGAEVLLYGIIRMGYTADLESTNIFMTGYLVFYAITFFILLATMALIFGLPAIWNKTNRVKSNHAFGAPIGWQNFMRGTICRIAYLGYPQFCVFSMWELYRRDSAAEVVLAITVWLVMTIILGSSTFGVFKHVRSSKGFSGTLTYPLYFDPSCLAKWGCLYVHYKAETFYFMIPLLVYTVVKGMIIAFAQHNAMAQAIVLLILEAGFLASTAIIRPYMNKKSNTFAIITAAINFVNAIFILVFSDIFNQPDLMTGIMGVLFFLYNAIFTLILTIFLLIGLFYACQLKEPTPGSQLLYENRASYKSTKGLIEMENRQTVELIALQEAATTEEYHQHQRPYTPLGHSTKSVSGLHLDLSNNVFSDSRWNIDHGHDGNIYNVRHSAAPPSPFEDPIEPTLPLIPSSSSIPGRRAKE